MVKARLERLSIDAGLEIERFASFPTETRRFIAYALAFAPALPGAIGGLVDPENLPLPFLVSEKEFAERERAYAAIPSLRACGYRGVAGQKARRQEFGALLAMAKVDLKWKRLIRQDYFIFCYERLVGSHWRQLLPLCWNEAALQRRRDRGSQLPLDRRLVEDASIPNSLDDDPPPMFYPTAEDADATGLPLLGVLLS